MAEAMILRRGGGGSRSIGGGFAVIGVEYPAGSSCTCEKDGLVLRARGTNGAAAFSIPETGVWQVRITDGTRQKNESVSITLEGQVKCVKLAYDIFVFEDGALAEGYSIVGNAEVASDSLIETNNGGFYLTPAIDLTGIKTVTLTGALDYIGAGGYTSAVGFSKTPGDSLGQGDLSGVANWAAADSGSSFTKAISVNSLNGLYYLCSARVGNRMRLTEIKLS